MKVQANIEAILAQYTDPCLNQSWDTTKTVKSVLLESGKAIINIVLPYPAKGLHDQLINDIKARILALEGIQQVEINLSWRIDAHAVQPAVAPIANIKNIIAVASGKGGVGKSTTAANLALALQVEGAKVGVLDADIYGPNQPQMLGGLETPTLQENKKMLPVMHHGLQTMSIGYLVNPETPMIWRGPMVTMALQQLLRDTLWDNLDYLIVDLPPGTGDIQLTLSQKIPVAGAVIVTTPQDIALLDARKGLEMFRKVKVPVLGVIENMSVHICSQCGHQESIFGSGGGQHLAETANVELLGQLPLDLSIRENADRGRPSVIADPESAIAQRYRDIARRLAARLSLQPKNYASKFPKIVVE
jgi:ATP-binding protein involved in chromosome partitioning